MMSKKMIAVISAAALAACLALAGCGGSQTASGSAASAAASSAASAAATAESAAASSAAAATESAAAAESPAAESASATTTAPATTTSSADAYVGDQAALDAALADAGFTSSDVTELEVELDLDDAVVHYDVSFKQGGMEYDYDIDAATGAIINSSSEVDD